MTAEKLLNLYLWGLIIVSVFLCGIKSAQAVNNDSTADPEVFMLGEILVTAEKTEPESAASISEVSSEDIQRQNAKNVGDAIKLLPGVYFRQGRSKAGYYVTVRGFEQKDVLILLDGVPISVPYEGLVDLPDIPVQNISRIKVIKGNASTLYGPNAMGGVINIITKKGGDVPATTLAYKLSDYHTQHFEATTGGKLADFRYFLGGSHRESDGFNLAREFKLDDDLLASMAASPGNPIPNKPIPTDDHSRDNSYYQRDSVMFTGDLAINPNNNLGLSMEYYSNDYGIPPTPIYREHKKGFYYFPRYWQFTDWERYTINLIEESRIAESFRTKTRVYYDDYENTLNIYDDDSYLTQDRIGPPSGESMYDDYSLGGSMHMFWDTGDTNQVRFGFSGKKDVHKESFQDNPKDRLESQTYSIALEDELAVADNLQLTLGGSYDMFKKKDRKQFDNPDGELGDDLDTFSPLVGIVFNASPELNLFASYARKVRFPTMRNLYADGEIGPQGNPDLKEEKADKYEIGAGWNVNPNMRIEGALFYNDVTDLINFDNMLGRFEQYGDVNMYGLEFTVSGNITDTLSGSIGYTYLKTDNNSYVTIENNIYESLVYKPDEVPYRPEHKVDFGIRQDLSWGTKISFNGSYISSQTYYNHADPANNKALVAEKEKLDDYVLLNLKISQPISPNLDVEIAGENLLNQEYETIDMFPCPGITGWIGFTLKI